MSARALAERLDGLGRALQAAVRLANDTDATDDVTLIVAALADAVERTAGDLLAQLGEAPEVAP
jgi:hypothetical protein